MKLSHVFIFNTIVALAYGIGGLVIPATILGWHGMSQGPTEVLLGQFFGVSLIGIGLVTLLARNVADPQALDAITLGLLISDVIGLVVSLMGVLGGVMNAVGWGAVAIYVLLTLGYGYFRFFK